MPRSRGRSPAAHTSGAPATSPLTTPTSTCDAPDRARRRGDARLDAALGARADRLPDAAGADYVLLAPGAPQKAPSGAFRRPGGPAARAARLGGGQHLDLHLGHVDAGRAFAPAALAGDAQLHRLHHHVRGECVRPELAGHRSRKVLARPRVRSRSLPVTRKHGHITSGSACGIRRCCCTSRPRPGARPGTGLGRPVEHRRDLRNAVVGPVAEQPAVVHERRARSCRGS